MLSPRIPITNLPTFVIGIVFMCILSLVPFEASAQISNIIFTTDPQTVAVGTASEKISIQSQLVGAEQKIPETADIFLESSSATGQFSSSNTNWTPVDKVTMSKNSANRSFYYKDTVAGVATLTARLVFRESGGSWSATQTITIGESSSRVQDAPQTVSTTTVSSATTTSSVEAPSRLSSPPVGLISAHDSPLNVGDPVKVPARLTIDAGRERIGVVHAPLTFAAEIHDQSGKQVKNAAVVWSFGDGTAALGDPLLHTYLYPGDYVVIVNAQKDDLAAVDRTIVHIRGNPLLLGDIEPGITQAFVEIRNTGSYEVNVARWVLVSGMQTYVFPADTIVPARAGLRLPYAVTKLMLDEGSSVSLRFPDGVEAHTARVSRGDKNTLSTDSPGEKSSLATSTISAPRESEEKQDPSRTLAAIRATLIALEKQYAPAVTRHYVAAARAVPPTQDVAYVTDAATASVHNAAPMSNLATTTRKLISKQRKGLFDSLLSLFK